MWGQDCAKWTKWYGHGLELPLTMDAGKTAEECVMLERGQKTPSPADEGCRNEQINIRLTLKEKRLLDDRASRGGYRGLSDYVRAKATAGDSEFTVHGCARDECPFGAAKKRRG